MAKFSGFEKTGLKPLNFIRIAEFELFGKPKWLTKFSGFEKIGLKPLNLIRIAEFELFGEPKWLNLPVSKKKQA